MKFLGAQRNLALFESRGKSVVVNTRTLTASLMDTPPTEDQIASLTASGSYDPVWEEIAQAAIKRASTPTDITLSTSNKRSYTVPKKVALTASSISAKDIKSPTARYVASLLASGEQVGCEDVLWVSRFFDSHDQSSTDRSLWLAWGGEEGQRWSTNLASRLDYDSVVADAGSYETPGVEDFVNGTEADRTFWAMLQEPGSQYAHSLYKLTASGTWMAWGNGEWLDCDSPEAGAGFIELDDEAALYVAGALFDAPDTAIDLRTPNPEAWDLAQAAYDEIDWTLIDRVVAAGGPVTDDYTPEERAANAESQIRDANGRFAEVGATGAIKSSGIGGTIAVADSATKIITVKGDDGNTYEVPADDFEVGAAPHPKVDPTAAKDNKLDLTGILAPNHEEPAPKAQLHSASNILSPGDINDALENYSAYVNDERQAQSKNFRPLLLDKTPADGEIPSLQAAGAGTAPAGVPEEEEGVPAETANPTPDESDVDPVYFAIVDREDPQAVMDLVALVPATAVSNDPQTFKRSGGKWVAAPEILRDIRSATPPAIVQLNEEQYQDVLAQVDMSGGMDVPEPPASEETITAAGGADRNRGGAEKLRRYWTIGEGGAKIRWGTGGDWTRCVRLLSKHLGPRAKGYCALRHKEMTGMWPGDKKNREMSSASLTASGSDMYSTDYLINTSAVLRASAHEAAAETARMRVRGEKIEPIPPSPEDISEGRSGRAFKIPLVIPEGIATGDGRIFKKGSIGMRTLPLPLLWQISTGEGHDGSVLVGRIDRVERTEAGLGNAYGVFDTGPYGQEAQRLVESGMLRHVSADLDKFEIDEDESDLDNGKMVIKKCRLMGATIVPKPAFQEVIIELPELEGPEMLEDPVPSGITASATIAASIPVEPPSTWFDRPILNGPTPITVTDEGQVFGHIATWDQDHIGHNQSVRAPRSASGYAYFHTGVVRTAEGMDVKVGQLTLAGGHAPLYADASAAVKHYDDTASAIADVHAGEDRFGIYVAGALRPGATPEQVRALRASAPSGDWRAINGRLELVACCQVNVPGFPVPRALAASGGMASLVAAGMAPLTEMREAQFATEEEALVASARERVYRALDIDGYLKEFKTFSPEKREKLSKDGKALPDGSFPIENSADLRRAVQAYGRASSDKKAKVRRHIVKRARALGKESMVPSDWKELSISDKALAHRDRYDSMVASARQQKVEELRSRVFAPSAEELSARAAELRSRIQK